MGTTEDFLVKRIASTSTPNCSRVRDPNAIRDIAAHVVPVLSGWLAAELRVCLQPVRFPQCGFKVCRAELLTRIVPHWVTAYGCHQFGVLG